MRAMKKQKCCGESQPGPNAEMGGEPPIKMGQQFGPVLSANAANRFL
jgi:hypothetical protein